MRTSNRWQWSLFVAMAVLGALTFGGAVTVQAVSLENTDCAKCHDAQPQQIEANGGKHKSAVGCTDCHIGHPPKVSDNIPQCSMCHAGEPHFALANCLGCHTNPHTPLDITLAGELKPECLTCHGEVGNQLSAKPSKHTELFCNFCHADKHGAIPECSQCHEPHSAEMAAVACGSCHGNAHQPLVVTYADTTPDSSCAACHGDIAQTLKASKYKHSQVSCATCHQEKHKMIPACADCHGVPHPPEMLQNFKSCLECHLNPHDLYK